MSGTVGKTVTLEWYDGPLLEIAPVDFPDRDRHVQVETLLYCGVVGVFPNAMVTVRFSRENLQAMLDMIDGKHVEDFFDPVTPPVIE